MRANRHTARSMKTPVVGWEREEKEDSRKDKQKLYNECRTQKPENSINET
jgi:hypothetical protein